MHYTSLARGYSGRHAQHEDLPCYVSVVVLTIRRWALSKLTDKYKSRQREQFMIAENILIDLLEVAGRHMRVNAVYHTKKGWILPDTDCKLAECPWIRPKLRTNPWLTQKTWRGGGLPL